MLPCVKPRYLFWTEVGKLMAHLRNTPSPWAMVAVIPDRGLERNAMLFCRAVRDGMDKAEALMARAGGGRASNDNPPIPIPRKSRIIMP